VGTYDGYVSGRTHGGYPCSMGSLKTAIEAIKQTGAIRRIAQ
jgi:hypothetical protein